MNMSLFIFVPSCRFHSVSIENEKLTQCKLKNNGSRRTYNLLSANQFAFLSCIPKWKIPIPNHMFKNFYQ